MREAATSSFPQTLAETPVVDTHAVFELLSSSVALVAAETSLVDDAMAAVELDSLAASEKTTVLRRLETALVDLDAVGVVDRHLQRLERLNHLQNDAVGKHAHVPNSAICVVARPTTVGVACRGVKRPHVLQIVVTVVHVHVRNSLGIIHDGRVQSLSIPIEGVSNVGAAAVEFTPDSVAITARKHTRIDEHAILIDFGRTFDHVVHKGDLQFEKPISVQKVPRTVSFILHVLAFH